MPRASALRSIAEPAPVSKRIFAEGVAIQTAKPCSDSRGGRAMLSERIVRVAEATVAFMG